MSDRVGKEEAGYLPGGGAGSRRCGDCQNYQNAECKRVVGKINPDDVCSFFKPLESSGNMSSDLATTYEPKGKSMADKDVTRPPSVVKSMFITRVSENEKTGERRFFATASGTKLDAYKERMSVDLFTDFIRRAENREAPPPQFTSPAWNGGLPYLGVAHYLDLGGLGIAGDVENIWVDGNIFKAKGRFRDSTIGRAVFRAVKKDIEENVPDDQRIRISIAFLDMGHEHEGTGVWIPKSLGEKCPYCTEGIGNKIYKQGHLIHLAATRVPAYEDTSLEIELEERSAMPTKKDDAQSIIGDELAEELEKASMVSRSGEPELITKSENEENDMDNEDKNKKKNEGDGEDEDEDNMRYESLAGAVTFDAAEEFVQRNASKVMDSPGMLESILVNIAGEDKRAMIEKAVRDYHQRVDVMAVNGMFEIAEALREGTLEVRNITNITNQTVDPESADPVDQAYLSLRERMAEAANTDTDIKTKLYMLQKPFQEIASAVERSFDPASEQSDPAAPASGGMTAQDVAAAVQSVIQPVVDRVNALEAGALGAGAVRRTTPEAPPSRSFQPDPTTAIQRSTGTNVNPNSLKNIARKNSGLPPVAD